jgi:hypothetical protein
MSNQIKTCENCGLGTKEDNGQISCFKYRTLHDAKEEQHCTYFKEIIFEEGEPLSPLQHLLLREEDLKIRMIKGVV